MLGFKRFKEVIVPYGLHSPFVRQMFISWSTSNIIFPKDWKDLVTVVLEPCPQLQWRTWLNDKARTMNNQVGIKVLKFTKTNFWRGQLC